MTLVVFFFFQAEDGIRDFHVTGVQTCALPISHADRPRQPGRDRSERPAPPANGRRRSATRCVPNGQTTWACGPAGHATRSEERRVRKECRYGCATYY